MSKTYNKCPHCNRTLPAHKGHTKKFTELTKKQQGNSIKMSTINLKNAMRNYSKKSKKPFEEIFYTAIKSLVK